MTQIEKIRAEIERLKSCKLNLEEDTEYLRGYDFAIDTIEEFINSLPAAEEHPSEDFKEEFDNFCVHGNIRNPNFEGTFGYDDIRKTAIHFAQWQKERLIKKAYQWLQHNAEKYCASYSFTCYQTGLLLNDFKHAMEDK